VGQGASNNKRDVVRVQTALNLIPPESGGPDPKLKMDDWIGPKTIAAITKFQKKQFGSADGKIDPGQRTEALINQLEGTDQTVPKMLLGAARDQAKLWTQAAIQALASVSGPASPDSFVRDSLLQIFLVDFSGAIQPPGSRFKTGTATELNKLKSAFTRMAGLLQADSTFLVIRTEYEDMYGYIAPDRYHEQTPMSAVGQVISPHYKFCDWDPVNEFGFGPKTRAGMILQAAAVCALGLKSDAITANRMWIEAMMASPDTALDAADRYSYFAQQMLSRTRPLVEFCHYPDTVGWKDVAGLP